MQKTSIIHFVGIGGIGMSALAQLFYERACHVTGSDRSESPVTEMLAEKGITVLIGHNADHVPHGCDLLVYSDAIPEDNEERAVARERGIREQSYFEALGDATADGLSIVISGTHGKTTTTAMVAKMLIEAGKKPTVICGSLMSEYGSNFLAGSPDLFVIEGCEYRRHFTKLHPRVLVITNIELDHTDYFRDLSDLQAAFSEATHAVPEHGAIVVDPTSETIRPTLHRVKARVVPYPSMSVPTLKVPGPFNRANAQAAKTAALALFPELDTATLDRSLENFSGTWRRFEYKGITKEGAVVYDDYAHHPTAIRATLLMAREQFPDKRILVAFHPHLYSRTRDFMDAFASALALADEVFLAPIYPARETPIAGVTSDLLAEKIHTLGTAARALDSLPAMGAYFLSQQTTLGPETVLITMGAGNIYQVADTLTH